MTLVDFNLQAICSNPSAGEAWKRRGQARAATGEFVEARIDASTREKKKLLSVRL